MGYECDSFNIVNAFLSGLGEGFANIAQGIASSLYGATVGLGEQFTLTGMDVYNSYFGDNSYQYQSPIFQGTYNISASGGSWGNTIAEATLQISGYRFGNQIYNSLQTGAQTGNWNSFSQNMGQAAFMSGTAAVALKNTTVRSKGTFLPEEYYEKLSKIPPRQAAPYDIKVRVSKEGNPISYTTYDKYGNRAYQYEISPNVRHGEGYHIFDNSKTGGTGNGPRSDHFRF